MIATASSENIEIDAVEPLVTWVRVSCLGEVEERVAKANRRLGKAGLTDRFELTVGEQVLREVRDEYTRLVTQRYFVVPVELVTPQIGYNGWTFVATLVFEQAGTIVRTVPGQACSYRPADKVCDQCHTARERTETFVVFNAETGEYKQLGRNCLELFFGLKPSLWVYEVELSEFNEESERGSYSRGVEFETVENIVAAALGATDGGKGYVSKNMAEVTGRVATSHATSDVLYARHESETGRGAEQARQRNERLDAARAMAQTYLANGTVAQVIEAAKAIDGASEYAENIRILANSEFVSIKNLGFVASFVAVWSRVQVKAAEAKAIAGSSTALVSEFIGTEGEKKVETSGVVTGLRKIDGDFGTTLLVEWTTVEGNVCKWFVSNWYQWNEGGKTGLGVVDTPVELGTAITVTGTVKRHESYNGRKATSFTRCKLVAS